MAGPKTPSAAAKRAAATPTTAGASKRANTSTVVASSSTSSSSAAASASKVALHTLWGAYLNTTSSRLKFVDAFLVFLILSGVIQFVYCVLVTSFPFNAFLAGCVSCGAAGSAQILPLRLISVLFSFFLIVWLVVGCGWDRFASTVGQFVLTASLRSQVNVANRTLFKDVSSER